LALDFGVAEFRTNPKQVPMGLSISGSYQRWRNIWRKMNVQNEMVPQMNRASAQQGGLGLFHIGTDYLPESSGYHLVVPKKWFIATKWGTVYTCTIQMLYFSMGFQEKLFFSSEETIIFDCERFPNNCVAVRKLYF
jgi:hypothetical protein